VPILPAISYSFVVDNNLDVQRDHFLVLLSLEIYLIARRIPSLGRASGWPFLNDLSFSSSSRRTNRLRLVRDLSLRITTHGCSNKRGAL